MHESRGGSLKVSEASWRSPRLSGNLYGFLILFEILWNFVTLPGTSWTCLSFPGRVLVFLKLSQAPSYSASRFLKPLTVPEAPRTPHGFSKGFREPQALGIIQEVSESFKNPQRVSANSRIPAESIRELLDRWLRCLRFPWGRGDCLRFSNAFRKVSEKSCGFLSISEAF